MIGRKCEGFVSREVSWNKYCSCAKYLKITGQRCLQEHLSTCIFSPVVFTTDGFNAGVVMMFLFVYSLVAASAGGLFTWFILFLVLLLCLLGPVSLCDHLVVGQGAGCFYPLCCTLRKHTYIVLTPLNPTFIEWNWGLHGYTSFFLFLLKNIGCGYSLEPPLRGGSN